MISPSTIPPFRPSRWLPGGHAQTLAGFLLKAAEIPYSAQPHQVELDDGDKIVLHDDCPEGWSAAMPVAMLVHGLCGCHGSGYMQRITAKLLAREVRVFRMDMRGSGAGAALAQHPMHSDRTGDVAAALVRIAELCPAAPVSLVGFSLGGNLVLNTAAGWEGRQGNLAQVLAVCPPIDLIASSRFMTRPAARIYERHFVGLLMQFVEQRNLRRPELPPIVLSRRPRSLAEFDHQVTAPLAGFASGEEYYRRTSPAPRLAKVEVPTRILAAADDPLVPAASLQAADSGAVELVMIRTGGHLGFISQRQREGEGDLDRRWLDWRVVDWVCAERL